MNHAEASTDRYELRFSERMWLALHRSDIPVQELADRLEVSRNSVSSWINGRTRPRRRDLRAFALATGYPITWLETGMAPVPEDEGQLSHLSESNRRPIHYE